MTTPPDISVWLGDQASQPGWMLSNDHGVRRILDMPRTYGNVLLGDPLGRAPQPQQHKLEYAQGVYRRPDYDSYQEDFESNIAWPIYYKTMSFPDVYVGGFHDQVFWMKQAQTGRISGLIRSLFRLFHAGGDTFKPLIVRRIVVDGSGLAINNNWWEYCCNVAIAMGYPICANAQSDPGGLLSKGPQYVESWIERARAFEFNARFVGNPNINILALDQTSASDVQRWSGSGWGVVKTVGDFGAGGELPGRWAGVAVPGSNQ